MMKLDARQRAMLREIGVKVWWPAAEAEPPGAAAEPARPQEQTTSAPLATPVPVRRPPGSDSGRTEAGPARPTAPAMAPVTASSGWQLGPLQTLYEPADSAAAPRWLVLVEQREETAGAEAGSLLQAMLQAAGLQQAHTVYVATLRRSQAPDGVTGLEEALAQSEPDLVFIMGRLIAQALLESSEPLGQLRGQLHDLWGLPALVSYDSATLLRHPADKAKAWDDLCMAVQVAREQQAQREQNQGS